jgi:hypothetical protein
MVFTISEDCLIFYGLTPDIAKMRQVYSALSDFIRDKQQIDPSGRFNIIAFLHGTPNYLDNYTFDTNLILETLKLFSKNIVRANLAMGILASLELIIQNFKDISEKLFRLLILVDGRSYKIDSKFADNITNLINIAKILPFYLEIIGIEINNDQESEKLKKLANLGNGEFYNVKKIKDLKPLLRDLSKKQLTKEFLYSRYNLFMAQKETQNFYVELADAPQAFHGAATCSICFQEDQEGIVICPSCKIVAHKICWAIWAKDSTPQIPHVFRCHNCFRLLKLDNEFVSNVHIGKISPIKEFTQVKRKNNIEYLREIESENKPKLIQAEDPMVTDVRTIIESKKANNQSAGNEIPMVCPVCDNLRTGDYKKCPICGYIFE